MSKFPEDKERVELDLRTCQQGGGMIPGAYGNVDGFPLHMKVSADGQVLELRYQVQFKDRIQRFTLIRPKPRAPIYALCPKCGKQAGKLALDDGGAFTCLACIYGARPWSRVKTVSKRGEYEKAIRRIRQIRARLMDQVNPPDEIIWPRHKMPKARWLGLLAELDVLEPRVKELCREAVQEALEEVQAVLG